MAALFTELGRLMFGQVREDATVETTLVRSLNSPSRVMIVASGGCTAFSLLAGGSYEVHALDINRAQIALVELKQKMFEQLGFAATRDACATDARKHYASITSLSDESRQLMDSHMSQMRGGLNNAGAVDQNIRTLADLFHWSVHARRHTEAFLSMYDLGEQEKYYRSEWSNWQWRIATAVAFDKKFLSLAGFHGAAEMVPPEFSVVMRQKLERALTKFPNAINPYLWQTFLQRYPERGEQGLPIYLQEASQAALLGNLGNLHLHCEDALGWFVKQESNSLDFFGLSNVLELLPAQYRVQLMPQIIRCARPGALICVRSIFPRKEPTFAANEGGLTRDVDLSARAEAMDRSLFCNFIEVYRRT